MKTTGALLDSIIKTLQRGGVGVLPTDTLYGLVGSALNKKAVKKIFVLKKRNPNKPCIILISDIAELALFGVALKKSEKSFLENVWPGKVSVVLSIRQAIGQDRTNTQGGRTFDLSYLQPLNNTLAFRVPRPLWLRNLLKATGPLVAPSANIEGLMPATTIKEAKKYFGKEVDFYLNKGVKKGKPSTLVAFQGGRFVVLRSGALKIN